MTKFPNCKKLHGVQIHGSFHSWNNLIHQAEGKEFPKIIHATPTLETLLAILNAMKHKKVIALIDPTTPAHIEYATLQRLNLFLERESDDTFGIILLTSGTTGTPKMLLLREEALYYSALGAIEFFKINSSAHLLLSLPLSHVSGLGVFFRSFLADATLHLFQGSLSTEFTESKDKITHLSLVRTQANRFIENDLFKDCPALRCVLLGGSSFPEDLLHKMGSYPFSCYSSYGMSETASVVWAYSLQEHRGKVLPYREISSRNNAIIVGGKTLFSGYIKDDGSLVKPSMDGSFETADQGVFDEENEMLTLFGRSDDLFLFGGENISIQELEESLAKIPHVKLAMVLPLPSSIYGHVPLAILATPLEHDFATWKNKFLSVLPKVKIPKAVITLDTVNEDAPDAKQQLAKLKKQIREKLATFEDLPEGGMVQKWSLLHIREQSLK